MRAAATQRQTYPVLQDDKLQHDVERLLYQLITRELELIKQSEKLRQELNCRHDFNYEALFKEIDDWNYNYIDANNLKRYFIKTGNLVN